SSRVTSAKVSPSSASARWRRARSARFVSSAIGADQRGEPVRAEAALLRLPPGAYGEALRAHPLGARHPLQAFTAEPQHEPAVESALVVAADLGVRLDHLGAPDRLGADVVGARRGGE